MFKELVIFLSSIIIMLSSAASFSKPNLPKHITKLSTLSAQQFNIGKIITKAIEHTCAYNTQHQLSDNLIDCFENIQNECTLPLNIFIGALPELLDFVFYTNTLTNPTLYNTEDMFNLLDCINYYSMQVNTSSHLKLIIGKLDDISEILEKNISIITFCSLHAEIQKTQSILLKRYLQYSPAHRLPKYMHRSKTFKNPAHQFSLLNLPSIEYFDIDDEEICRDFNQAYPGATNILFSGYYSLTNDIVGTVTISVNDVTLNLQNHTITGLISVSGNNVIILNGFVSAPTPVSTTDAATAAITLNSGFNNIAIQNVFINCANSATSGYVGRNGINAASTTNYIYGCKITAGYGSASTALGTAGGAGGVGINITGSYTQAIDCTIMSGFGGAGFSGTVGTAGGAGGIGISAASSYNFFQNDIIISGTGGTGGNSSTGATAGGAAGIGGHGIHIVSGSANQIINCNVVSTGNGGNGGNSTGVTGKAGGSAGSAIQVEAAALLTFLYTNYLTNTGFGGTGGTGSSDGATGANGQAVTDLNPNTTSLTNETVTYNNFAYKIAQTAQHYQLHDSGSEGGTPVASAVLYNNVYVT